MHQIEKDRKNRALFLCAAGTLVALLIIMISLNTGSTRLTPLEILRTLMGFGSYADQLILLEYRLPRILVTVLAGAGLGLAGAVFQGVSRNALADPGILGIHAGAALGLIVFVSFFRTMDGPAALLIPIFTFFGGAAAAFIVILFSLDRRRGLLPIRLLLVGIAVAAGMSAVTLLLSLKLDEETYTFAARWLAGSVWGRDWIHVLSLLPWIVILGGVLYGRSRTLDLFSLGDDLAASVGSSVTRNRLVMLLLAVGLSCASVSMTGSIGFIGLIAPNIAKRLVGPAHRYMLPLSACIGTIILVAADTIGRSIFLPNMIPAGVVVAAVGGPYFLYQLMRVKN
ncbi:FecCD family ABC transporter permease [Paenibacillus lacisoli]|uniref:FecCD family ABC transporter permease n=1 Tax=Paenibacillus lacisoli TaxID=3064525 RepID=UPI00387E4942